MIQLKGKDGQSSCQLRDTVHSKCSGTPTPGLDSTPFPSLCTCNNVYFNIWSACSYASGNNTLPMYDAWLKTCTDASVDISASSAKTMQEGALGIQVPDWGTLAVPGNAAFDLQQAVVVVSLAQKKPWSLLQIVLPVVAGVVAILFTLVFLKFRHKVSPTTRLRQRISSILPWGHRVRPVRGPVELQGWEIEPAITSSSFGSSSRIAVAATGSSGSNRGGSPDHGPWRNYNRESTEPGHPSVPSNVGSALDDADVRQSRIGGMFSGSRGARPASQAVNSYPFDVEMQPQRFQKELKKKREMPTKDDFRIGAQTSNHSLQTPETYHTTPSISKISSSTNTSGSGSSGPSWIKKMLFLKTRPPPVRQVVPSKNFNIDGVEGIKSRATSMTGSSFSATGKMKSEGPPVPPLPQARRNFAADRVRASNDEHATGMDVDPVHEDRIPDGGEYRFGGERGRPHSYAPSFDDNESTNLISRRPMHDLDEDDGSVIFIGDDRNEYGGQSTDAGHRSMAGSASVNSDIKVVSPTASTVTASHRDTIASSSYSHESAPPVPPLPPLPVPPLPKGAAPLPPPARRTGRDSSEMVGLMIDRGNSMTPIKEDLGGGSGGGSSSNAVPGPSRQYGQGDYGWRHAHSPERGQLTLTVPSSAGPSNANLYQQQASTSTSTSTLPLAPVAPRRPLPSRSGSGDSTTSATSMVRPLPSPAQAAQRRAENHSRSASHSVSQTHAGSANASNSSLSAHVRTISNDNQPLNQTQFQSVLTPVRPNDPLRSMVSGSPTPTQQAFFHHTPHLHNHSGSSSSNTSGIIPPRTFSPLSPSFSDTDSSSFYMPDAPTPLQMQQGSRSGTPRNDQTQFQSVLTPVRPNDPLRPTTTTMVSGSPAPTQQTFFHSHNHSGSSSSNTSGINPPRTFSPLSPSFSNDTSNFYMPDTPTPLQMQQGSRSATPRNDPAAFHAGPIRGAGYGGA
ncbi:hypothetical protein D9613_000101 [Agrocybe pediades]|uniref:Uncharacterized protein n=1 Tax=Agrocybe pediades TaxID=84607 RepID=A0A8H4R1A5_9AGAR|nr:hypothetical protein D9613_000101 [Agrocybe pediades]